MKKEQKLYELSKELVYQMTGNYTEDVQDADFQIAWTFLNKAMDYTPCCDKLKDIETLTFEEWFKSKGYYIEDFEMYLKNKGKVVVHRVKKEYKKYLQNL